MIRLRYIIGSVVALATVVLVAFAAVLYPVYVNLESCGPNVDSVHLDYRAPPVPTGISDYGIIDHNGVCSAYSVQASQVVGGATIRTIAADNPDQGFFQFMALLQLNVVLLVHTSHGSQSYWIQNVVSFDTANEYVNLANQIWNYTSPRAVMAPNGINGNGVVSGGAYSMTQGLLGDHYNLPMSFDITTNVTGSPSGPIIDEGYHFYNGTLLGSAVWDNITINASGFESAAFEINGSHNPGIGYYNAELVFTGPPGDRSAAYQELSASIGMRYTLMNGTQLSPKSIWEFGTTGEAVTNLQTNYVNGKFEVAIGEADMNQDYITSGP